MHLTNKYQQLKHGIRKLLIISRGPFLTGMCDRWTSSKEFKFVCVMGKNNSSKWNKNQTGRKVTFMETHRVDPFSFFIYEFIIWVLLSVLWNCHLWQKEPPQGSCCVWKNSIDGAALSSSKAEGRSLQEPSDSTPAAFQCDRLSPAVPQKKL